MKRVYYHYTESEEFVKGGMWRNVKGVEAREGFSQSAADLMRNVNLFRKAMLTVLDQWPRSCETNMTSTSTNQQAWMGHAGCFLATASPEDCTRLGWHMLTQTEQDAANLAADDAIAEWRRRYSAHMTENQLSLFGAV